MDGTSSSKAPFEGNTQNALNLNLNPTPEKYHDIQTGQSLQGELRKLEPEWLDGFLKCTFSEPCSEHSFRWNGLNKYCIDCDAPLCKYCVSLSTHKDHRLLKIHRYVNKNVVALDDIEQLIEYSEIQQYRCNMQQVLALTPLPHSGSQRSDNEPKCQTCNRKLMEEHHTYCYCSIYCKAEAFTKKEVYDSRPFLSLDLLVPNGSQRSEEKKHDDHPAKKQKLESDVTKVVVDQLVENEEIDVDKMIVDEPLQKEEADVDCEMLKQASEMEIMASEQLLRMANQVPTFSKEDSH